MRTHDEVCQRNEDDEDNERCPLRLFQAQISSQAKEAGDYVVTHKEDQEL